MSCEFLSVHGCEKKKVISQLLSTTDISSNDDVCEKIADFPKYASTWFIQKFITRYELCKLLKDKTGDIIEMGVCGGGGLFSIYHSLQILENCSSAYRRIYGFDTFDGFPKTSLSDKDPDTYGEKAFSFEKDKEIIDIFNIHNANNNDKLRNRVNLVKGDIFETVPQFLEKNKHIIVAMLYLDLDIYKPTKFALEQIIPRMPKGSIIAFDELNHPNWPGETLALLETLNIRDVEIKNIANSTVNYLIL